MDNSNDDVTTHISKRELYLINLNNHFYLPAVDSTYPLFMCYVSTYMELRKDEEYRIL